ncbi:hypothetical protein BG004_005033 [Podila humilis]|nr:hypothetical protein BG004_005033 [Podila humilis]
MSTASDPRILKIAVVSGPQYDRLYERLAAFEAYSGYKVEIVFRGSHPELNDYLATTFQDYDENASPSPADPELDLISTHIKYAPSQVHFLQELGKDLVSIEERSEFLEAALDSSMVQGKLYQLPRMVDSRVVFYRADVFDQLNLKAPTTWDDLLCVAQTVHQAEVPTTGLKSTDRDDIMQGYAFPGKLSGLFGTFYELALMQAKFSEALFDRNDNPVFDEDTIVAVLQYLRRFVQTGAVPRHINTLYFDDVSSMFAEGKLAMVADWPSFYGDMKKKLLRGNTGSSMAASQLPRICVMQYPVGANNRRSAYSGMHSFAIPKTRRNLAASLALLKFLVDDDQQWIEASESGSFPTKKRVIDRLVAETERQRELHPADVEAILDCDRLSCLKETIENDMAMFPHLKTYPELEDALYPIIQDAMMGRISELKAARKMKEVALVSANQDRTSMSDDID